MTSEADTSLEQIQLDFNKFLLDAALSLKDPLSPLEDFVDKVIDFSLDVANRVLLEGPIADVYSSLIQQSPRIAEVNLPTPLGEVRTPELSLPELRAIKIDSRRREAFKSTVAIDASLAVGLIPAIGDIVADVVEDIYGAKLRGLLTPKEMDLYSKFDKLGPSTVALARTFIALSIRS